MKKPVALIIRDGWGLNDEKEGNAVLAAHTPNMDAYRKQYPWTILECAGEPVGLPDGYQGSSEVGHLNMGAGRIVVQELRRIDNELSSGILFDAPEWKRLMGNWRENSSRLHLLGLLQDEGVHAHQKHLFKIMARARQEFPDGEIVIHPFLDGNGRIGRLLITLYLVSHGLLTKPSLYLSAHLEKHRGAYYDALTRVRESNDMGHWCRFFLQAMFETAENGKQTFQRILALRQDLERKIVTLGRRSEKGRRLITYLYEHPAVTVHQVMELLNIQFNPAGNVIAALVDMGVLKEITGQKRNRVFLFEPYLKIFTDSESET